MKKKRMMIGLGLIVILSVIAFFIFYTKLHFRNMALMQWLRDPKAHQEWKVIGGERCRNSVFIIPSDGYIGYLWGDSFRPFHQHQGIDIFSGTAYGVTPVFAAYDGYLTRLEGWKSSLIIRIPEDPLQPDRQIWIYMTHLADSAGNSLIDARFPAGSEEIPVRTGDLLGYQGNYSGNPGNPVGVHLHFSIVNDDGSGNFLNELEIKNTLDPSPYFNLELNGAKNSGKIPVCH